MRNQILPLKQSDVAQIRSSVVITCLRDVVVGLLKNCLDAEARKVELEVDLSCGRCECKDDGHGIAATDFDAVGGLLKPHWTSKHNEDDAHGHNGIFLASLAAMSHLVIQSPAGDPPYSSTITARYSAVIARSVSHVEDNLPSARQGTRVLVQNLFGNMPVRVKQRQLQAHDNDHARDLALLRRDIVALLLAWPRAVSLRLHGVTGQGDLLLGRPDRQHVKEPPRSTHAFKLDAVLRVLTQAGFIAYNSWPSWVPVAASNSSFKVKGAVSLDPSPTKQVQFVSLGIRPVHENSGSSELLTEINRVFSDSSFGVIQDDLPDQDELQRRSKDRRFKQDGFTSRQINRGHKGCDRWPMFVLKVDTKSSKTSNTSDACEGSSESNPYLARIIDLVCTMMTQWLDQHHFRPHKWRSTAIQFRRPLYNAPVSPSEAAILAEAHASPGKRDSAQVDDRGSKGSRSFVKALLSYSDGWENHAPEPPDDSPYITWVHPTTRQALLIDRQSGSILPPKDIATIEHESRHTSPRSAGCAQPPRKSLRLEAQRPVIAEGGQASRWVDKVRTHWSNPVFAACEMTIPEVDHAALDNPIHDAASRHSHISPLHDDEQQALTKVKLSACDLKTASVISQLDAKFILVKLFVKRPHMQGDSTMLIIIDQHAADERIKVEQLYCDLCSGLSVVTRRELSFSITSGEASLFQAHRRRLELWGLSYTVEQLTGENCERYKGHRLVINSLPAGILERCVNEPRLLIEMLRAEIWRDEKEKSIPARSLDDTMDSGANSHTWMKQIAKCPHGIIEMLNSRACRSAIMFNDQLSNAACQDLIDKLAKCVLPFQCAHGRPSMVPLTGTGDCALTISESLGRDEYAYETLTGETTSFAAAYKAWCEPPHLG